MRLKNRYFNLLLLAFIFFAEIAVSAEVDIPAKPLNHLVDLAGIIDPNAVANLNGYLLELEQKTTVQMVILTILEGNSIEDLSLNIAHEKWQLGQKDKDNGLLLLVSLQDRQYRFEVGYGLEAILTDAFVSSVGRQYLVPYFREGEYSTGITVAALAVINEIASSEGVEISGMPRIRSQAYQQSGREEREPTLLGNIFTIIFAIVMIYLFIRHPRLFMLFLFMNMMGGSRRGSWGGGGGFGGGSFGGGGGGGFGGGGATGRW